MSGREGEPATPNRVVDSLRSFGHVLATPVRELAGLWRRSIQARVVIGTVILSTVLTMLAGWILLRQVTDGLLDSKEQTSIAQARSGAVTAQAKLDGAEITDTFDVAPLLKGLVETLAPRDEARDDFSVVIIGPLSGAAGDSAATGGSLFSGDIVPDESIPAPLMTRVTDEPGAWYAYTRVVYDDGEPVPGIVVGNQLIVPGTGADLRPLLRLPADRAAAVLVRRSWRADHRRGLARRPAGIRRLAGHPTGRYAGAAGAPDRRAARGRTARGADARPG